MNEVIETRIKQCLIMAGLVLSFLVGYYSKGAQTKSLSTKAGYMMTLNTDSMRFTFNNNEYIEIISNSGDTSKIEWSEGKTGEITIKIP